MGSGASIVSSGARDGPCGGRWSRVRRREPGRPVRASSVRSDRSASRLRARSCAPATAWSRARQAARLPRAGRDARRVDACFRGLVAASGPGDRAGTASSGAAAALPGRNPGVRRAALERRFEGATPAGRGADAGTAAAAVARRPGRWRRCFPGVGCAPTASASAGRVRLGNTSSMSSGRSASAARTTQRTRSSRWAVRPAIARSLLRSPSASAPARAGQSRSAAHVAPAPASASSAVPSAAWVASSARRRATYPDDSRRCSSASAARACSVCLRSDGPRHAGKSDSTSGPRSDSSDVDRGAEGLGCVHPGREQRRLAGAGLGGELLEPHRGFPDGVPLRLALLDEVRRPEEPGRLDAGAVPERLRCGPQPRGKPVHAPEEAPRRAR